MDFSREFLRHRFHITSYDNIYFIITRDYDDISVDSLIFYSPLGTMLKKYYERCIKCASNDAYFFLASLYRIYNYYMKKRTF